MIWPAVADIRLVTFKPVGHGREVGESEQSEAPSPVEAAPDVLPGVAATDGDQPVDIHKPKPVHGWREFFNEIGVIVIGVLIALGGEQTVEAIHWHGEVADAKGALRAELNHDLGAIAFSRAQSSCADQRADEIETWVASWRAGRPITLSKDIAGPARWAVHASVWDIVKTGQAAHFELRDELDFAQVYDVLATFNTTAAAENQAWTDLFAYDDARALTDADQRLILNRLRTIRRAHRNYATDWDAITPAAQRLGLHADVLKELQPGDLARLCASLLPPRSNTPTGPRSS